MNSIVKCHCKTNFAWASSRLWSVMVMIWCRMSPMSCLFLASVPSWGTGKATGCPARVTPTRVCIRWLSSILRLKELWCLLKSTQERCWCRPESMQWKWRMRKSPKCAKTKSALIKRSTDFQNQNQSSALRCFYCSSFTSLHCFFTLLFHADQWQLLQNFRKSPSVWFSSSSRKYISDKNGMH